MKFLNQDSVREKGEAYYVYDSDTLTRFGLVQEIIEEGIRSQAFRVVDANLAGQEILCLIHGVAHTVPEYPWQDSERVLDGCIDMAIHGLEG